MKEKEESEKVGLKHNIEKTKIIASGPITSWQIDGNNGDSDRLFFFFFCSNAAMKLKDACSLEEKLSPT